MIFGAIIQISCNWDSHLSSLRSHAKLQNETFSEVFSQHRSSKRSWWKCNFGNFENSSSNSAVLISSFLSCNCNKRMTLHFKVAKVCQYWKSMKNSDDAVIEDHINQSSARRKSCRRQRRIFCTVFHQKALLSSAGHCCFLPSSLGVTHWFFQ